MKTLQLSRNPALSMAWAATLLASGCIAGGADETSIDKSAGDHEEWIDDSWGTLSGDRPVDPEQYGTCSFQGQPGVCVDRRLCSGVWTAISAVASSCDAGEPIGCCAQANSDHAPIEVRPTNTLPELIGDVDSTFVWFYPSVHEGIVGRAELSLLVRHPWRGDLVITLTHADTSGHVFEHVLVDRPGGGQDSAADIDDVFYISGQGETIGGGWSLHISDEASGDEGRVVRANLRIFPR